MSIEHSDAPAGEIHVWANWEVADSTARLALTVAAGDVGKVAWQQDDDSFWLLTDDSPMTWAQLTGPGLTPAGHAASHENAGSDEIDVTGLSGVLADPQVANKLHETSDPADLAVGAILDGEILVRSGGTIVSVPLPEGGSDGVGDVVGPGAATDNAVARFDSTTGKLIQNSPVTLDDVGAITVPEMAAPSTPGANKVAIYAKTDGKLYIKDDAGTETDLTATGGAPTGSAGGDLTGTYPNPRVAQVNDANGNELLKFGTTASAVNEVTITNKATGNAPTIEATGGDTNVSLNLKSKGTGVVQANGVNVLLEFIQVACSDETTALTTGTAKITFRMPFALIVTEVRASLTTAQSSGSIFSVDINEGGTTILSTKLTIDNGEKTSTTAATPAVISDSSLADDAEITIDIDQIGDGTAKGLKVTIIGVRG